MAVSKLIELIGNSTVGWEDAARHAVHRRVQSLHGISSMEVVSWTAKVAEGEIVEYTASVKDRLCGRLTE